MNEPFTLTISPDKIAELKFDLPAEKINKFSLKALESLEHILDQLAQDHSIKALILISGKEGSFIAGADLNMIREAFTNPALVKTLIQTGHRIFNKLHNLPFPTVAVINGTCLGGGTECALACTYRVAVDHPKTLIGLPEVNLGIFPGWGGTQRLPRLVGLPEGLGMILSGKAVPAVKAYKIHLVDAILPQSFQKSKLDQFLASILTKEGKKKIKAARSKRPWTTTLLESNPLGRSILFNQAKKSIMEKTKGRYPAPLMALDLIKNSYTLSLDEGLKKEADTFIENTPQGFLLAKDLIGIFFTQEALKKEKGAAQALPIQYAGVLGAGTMGAGLSWLFADHQIHTRLKDISWELVGKGLGIARSLFNKGLKGKKITPSQAARNFQLISGTIDYSGFEKGDLVIEAATENLELKRKIFRELEPHLKTNALIATNTSSLTIDAMAESLKNPERLVGMHFFNPVPKMPLVEVVAGKQTSPEAVATAVEFCRKMGKSPVIVGDYPGFLVNRIFMAGANEVMLMLEEGYAPETLNKVLLDFGMPMGPFELADEVGVDVSYKVAESFQKAYGERMHPAKILGMMVEKGYLGKKTGSGFQIYKGTPYFNKKVKKMIASIGRTTSNTPEDQILPRFLYLMINEAARCLEENVIQRADYLDLALIMGMGFPPFQGGLLRYADRTGSKKIVETLNELTQTHGMRFTPCNKLKKMGETNAQFYPPLV